jgi:murein DD-endopeptidase MepM/ murein hydrolase activator NlpD
MPRSRTPLLLVLLGLSLVALVGAVVLVNGGTPGGVASVPTSPPTVGLPSSGTPTPAGSPGSGGTQVEPSTPTPGNAPSTSPPTDGSPTDQPARSKETGARSRPPSELTGYVWPLRNADITSRFAPRDFGGFLLIDGREIHDGLDLATHCGDEIRAAHDGTVIYAGRDFDVHLGYQGDAAAIYERLDRQGRVNTLPIVIVIDDGNGYRSLYVHLNRADVGAGQVVRAGDVIGAEGSTGFSTGCHLHYGLVRMDAGWQEVVPRLSRFGYPPLVRERIDPLEVLPWGDQYAPQRLQDRANATPTPAPSATP